MIERSGLVQGTYSENLSTLNNNLRLSVPPALSQVNKFSLSGTLSNAGAETFTVTINGKSKSYTTSQVINSKMYGGFDRCHRDRSKFRGNSIG